MSRFQFNANDNKALPIRRKLQKNMLTFEKTNALLLSHNVNVKNDKIHFSSKSPSQTTLVCNINPMSSYKFLVFFKAIILSPVCLPLSYTYSYAPQSAVLHMSYYIK